jgi:hypothetical protein
MRRFVIAALGVGLVLCLVWGIRRELRKGERKLKTGGAATIRQAIEDYASEHGVYPAAHSMRELKARLVRKDGTPLPIRDAFGMARELPMRDPWFRLWVVEVSDQNYSIRSFGADGEPDRDPPRGAMLDTEPAERDTIVVDGLALQHMWNWGGGGDQGGWGSIVSLGRGPNAGKIIFDYGVDVMRNGQVLASLPEAPARFQAPAGQYQIRVRLSGSDYFENVIVERGRVRHKSIRIAGASITGKEWSSFGTFLNPRAEVWQGGRLIASDCLDCSFYVVPGRYRFLLRDDAGILFDETRELKDGDEWVPSRPQGPSRSDGVEVQIDSGKQQRYASPSFTIEGNGVHQQQPVTWRGWAYFSVPSGKYELFALLSGQTVQAGSFELLPLTRLPQNVAVSWGDIHVSVDGPIEIHEASVTGWSAVVRKGDSVLARTERFPDVFFLLPGHYTVELLRDGRVRTSKSVVVALRSEQWIGLQE